MFITAVLPGFLVVTDLGLVGRGEAYILKGLILAQNERWRRGLGMQVEREPARGTAANGVVRRR